jgi:poly(A) polymerase
LKPSNVRGLTSTGTKYIAHPYLLNKAGSTGPRRLDISWPTADFTKMVKGWDKFDEVKMGIIVRHIKR